VSWVRNPAKIIASGDNYAVKLFNDYGKQSMPSFALSKKEVENIIAWVDAYQDKATGTVASCVSAKTQEE
jgi:hypothetical protein